MSSQLIAGLAWLQVLVACLGIVFIGLCLVLGATVWHVISTRRAFFEQFNDEREQQ